MGYISNPRRGITPTGTKQITQNGTYIVNVPNSYSAGDEGKVVSNGALVAQGSDTVTYNGVVDTTLISSLTVNVSGGGGGGAREGGICPAVVSTIPYSVSTSGLTDRGNGTWNIITEGFLPASAVGHQVLVLAETRSLSGITVSGFTQLYSAGLFTAFYGTLAQATSIEISATSQCYFSIVELDDRYEPAVYTNLCAALDNGATVNTSELKTANAFKVSAKLPSGYGILGLATNYDYASADYRPSAWEVLNRLIDRPEICFRRPSGEYDATGTAFFIKQNPASYNQYFLRGSVNGKIEDDTLNAPSDLTSVSSINDFKDVPTWNSISLSIIFIRLQERS